MIILVVDYLEESYRYMDYKTKQLTPCIYSFKFFIQTYNIDSQVGDSGACATALLCGVKGRFETVGLDDGGVYNRCDTSFGSRIFCLADWAQSEGESWNLSLLLTSEYIVFTL